MRMLLFIIVITCFITDITAQYNRTVVVEHFTNTVCSVCANRNPGFYENLNQHPDILHIAYHPSSPYASCQFNQHNVEDNDSRTNYYGVYGSTPVLVIAGEPIHVGTDYSDAALFEPYTNQNTNVDITIEQFKDAGVLYAQVSLEIDEVELGTEMWLTVPIVEKVVNYDAPNGETEHFDVFRKEATQNGNGALLSFTEAGSFSIDLALEVEMDTIWEFDQIYTMAILQDAETQELIQAAAVPPSLSIPINTIAVKYLQGVRIGPNPVKNELNIQLKGALPSTAKLFSLTGQLLVIKAFESQTSFDVNNLSPGIYIVEIKNEEGIAVEKILIE